MITATGQPTLRNPAPLPPDLQPGTGSVATRIETFTNGGPTTAGARWLDRNDSGQSMGWRLEGASTLDAAARAARSVVQFAAHESTVGDEGHEATTSRYVTPLAVLQSTDGAFFASRLTDAPLPGKEHVVQELTSIRPEGTPAAQANPVRDDNVSYGDTTPTLKGVVSENTWWPIGQPGGSTF